jgi:hypothetical protein
MAYTPKLLYATGYPATGGTTLYTVPVSTGVIVKNILLTNTTGEEAWVTLHIVPEGGSIQNSNKILSSYGVPGNGIAAVDCSVVMDSGSRIVGFNGQNNAVSVTVSGVEIA